MKKIYQPSLLILSMAFAQLANAQFMTVNKTNTGMSLNLSATAFAAPQLLTGYGINQTIRWEGLSSSGTTYNTAPTASSDALLFVNSSGDFKRWSGGTSVFYGRDASGVLTTIPFSSFTISADNGTNISSNTVKLGGTLLQNTDVPLAGFKLNFSGALGSVTFGTKNLQANYNVIDSGGIYAFRSGSNTTEVIRAVQGSTNAGAYGAYRADVNGAGYTSVIGYMGYHSSSGKTYGFYTNGADFSAWYERGLGIGGTQPTAKNWGLKVSNLVSGAGNPGIIALMQSTTSTTAGNALGSIYFGSSKDTIPEAAISVVRGASGTGGATDYPTDMVFYTSTDGAGSVLTDNLHLTFDGKIGLHKSVPTEALDLVGNLRLSGALMPNNLAGSIGDFYKSGGPGAPGTWGGVGQSGTTVFGTSVLNVPTTLTTFTLIPGLTQTITVPSNALIYIATDGGMATNSSSATGFSVANVAIAVDGTIPTNGYYKRISALNNGGLTGNTTSYALSVITTLTTGSHTIAVYGQYQQGTSSVISGGTGSVLQGELTVVILKQ